MFGKLRYLFNGKAATAADLGEFARLSYGSLCGQFWQKDQYMHVVDDYGTSAILGRSENDSEHPDRPDWLPSYMRTEFHQNNRLFRPINARFNERLELDGVKVKWLKGENLKTMRWYLHNMKKATDHPHLKLTLKGFELFENPELLDAMDDNERISLTLETECAGEVMPTKPVDFVFKNHNGAPCFERTIDIPATLDPQNQNDSYYIGMYALHYLAMTYREQDDRETIGRLDHVTFDGKDVPIADINSFAVTEDKGADSSYAALKGYRNKLSHYHPAFGLS